MKKLKYKGYTTTIQKEYDYGKCKPFYYGKIENVGDLVTFEATTTHQLEYNFKRAVDDYINTLEWLGLKLNKDEEDYLLK